LGPEVQAGEVVASVDEIVVRRPEKRRFLELGTAFVRTARSYRYLSGSIELVLQQLFLLLSLSGSLQTKITGWNERLPFPLRDATAEPSAQRSICANS